MAPVTAHLCLHPHVYVSDNAVVPLTADAVGVFNVGVRERGAMLISGVVLQYATLISESMYRAVKLR